MTSLYVHIPFCLHICSYCDFCKVFYKDEWANKYLEALKYELNDRGINEQFDTIYIGGGTPTSLSYFQLKTLLEILKPYSNIVKEYSIEINPETLNKEKVDLLLEYNINRISIGVQTFNDDLLRLIDRHHNSIQTIRWINYFKEKGINDINIDLMYGLPNQRLEDVYHDIDIIKKLDIGHVSIYSLILENHTVLYNKGYKPLSDEDDAYYYDNINAYLNDLGYVHYEISNYYHNKPSYHNLTYWLYNDYIGVGLGAHSLYHNQRIENTRSLTKYLNNNYLLQVINLDFKDRLFENIMMTLRLVNGININDINNRYNINIIEILKLVINKYEKLNMLEIDGNYLKTTILGMKYLNNILVDILDLEYFNCK